MQVFFLIYFGFLLLESLQAYLLSTNVIDWLERREIVFILAVFTSKIGLLPLF